MSKGRAFDYMQVPLAIVATDLTGASVEVEGAYFRLARLLGVNGPMKLSDIRRKIGEVADVEHLLDIRSTDAEPLFSFSWVEEWRERANASRERLSMAGKASADKRSKKKGKKNTSSTHVQQPLNGSSTNVEHATILSSTILSSQGSGKERANEKLITHIEDARFETLWANYGRIGSKPEAFRYWRSLNEPDRMAIEAKLPAYVASTPGGAFRKHLQGWINPKNRMWESAIVTVNPSHHGPVAKTQSERDAELAAIVAARYATQ